MKKNLLVMLAGLLISVGISAQKVKHFNAEDDLSGTWFNTGISATAEGTECGTGAYALYTISETADGALLKRNWWYDFGFVFTAEEWDAVNDSLFVSFWANPLDGINAGDSIELLFAVNSTFNEVTRERGWPTEWVTLAANTWTWVSVNMSEKGFEDNATIAEMTGETTFKMAPQPIADKYDLTTKAYKMAYQDVTLSLGPLAKPSKNPCGEDVSGGGSTGILTSVTKSLNFFPNPAKGSIQFNEASSGEIFNLAGKRVASFNNTNNVNIENLNSGVYFIKSGSITEKLIVK